MSHDGGSSCKSYIKHPTEKERLDNLAFTSFPEDYLPYTSSYHRKAPYLVWDDGFRPHRKRRLKRWRESRACRCCTAAALTAAISLIIIGILSIVAVSIYLGVITSLFRSPILSLSGKMSVMEGDEFTESLLNTTSYEFLAKAETYQAMLENIYLSSSLEPAFVAAKVYAFRKGNLTVFFRIYLDRRKLPQSDEETLLIARNVVLEHAVNRKPEFRALSLDLKSIEFRENNNEEHTPEMDFGIHGEPKQNGNTPDEELQHSQFLNHAVDSKSENSDSYDLERGTSTVEASASPKTYSSVTDEEEPGYHSQYSHSETESHESAAVTSPSHILKPEETASLERPFKDERNVSVAYGHWKPVPPLRNPTVESSSTKRPPPKENRRVSGSGSVHLVEELFIPVISQTPETRNTPLPGSSDASKPQPNVASTIMSSVSLVIRPSSRNRTVMVTNNKNNSIETVAKLPTKQAGDSTFHDVMHSESEQEVQTAKAPPIGTRNNHASLRFIEDFDSGVNAHVIPGTNKTEPGDNQKIEINSDYQFSKGFETSNSSREFSQVKSSHVILLHPNIPEQSSERYNDNETLTTFPSSDNIQNANSAETFLLTESTLGSDEAVSSSKDNHNESEKETVSTSSQFPDVSTAAHPQYSHTPQPEVSTNGTTVNTETSSSAIYTSVSPEDSNSDYIDGDKDEQTGSEYDDIIDVTTDILLTNLKFHTNENDSDSSGFLDIDSSAFSVKTDNPTMLLDASHASANNTNANFNNETVPVLEFPIENSSHSKLNDDQFSSSFVQNLPEVDSSDLGNDTAQDTFSGYEDEEQYNYSNSTEEETNSTVTANIYEQSNISAEESTLNGSKTSDLKAGGLPKVVPPFANTQYIPNDIHSDTDIHKNDDNHLDDEKLYPVTYSDTNVDLSEVQPSEKPQTGISKDHLPPDDENVVIHHITTPPSIPQNESAVFGLGKYPTYFLNKCSDDEIACRSGECIPADYQCNMRRDCRDNSDEDQCTCTDNLKVIGQTQKICDGIQDCWDLSDEENCPWCTPGQFICPQSKLCIEMKQVCDGSNDCPFGTDERYCVKLADDEISASSSEYQPTGYLMIRKEGQWGKLCLENLHSLSQPENLKVKLGDLGHAVCSALSYKEITEAVETKDEVGMKQSYFEISMQSAKKQSRQYSEMFQPSECQSKSVVHVTCKSLECGMRPMAFSLRRRIVGGHSTNSGSWPWQVALYKEGDFQCGAVLVSDVWLISAGHCFYSSQNAHWTARLGVLRRGTELPSPSEQIRRITHIFIHPDYVDKGFINDIALLRMDSPVPFSDFLRPLCLPEETEEVNMWHGHHCSVVGWGKLYEIGHTFPDSLQEVRLPVISTEECRKKILFLTMYHLTDNMFCAGYERGGRDACLGDSGGPLMCQRQDGRWVVLGVTSNGDGCGRPGRPGVYTKVTKYLAWIRQVIDGDLPSERTTICAGHRCNLGHCVLESKVCDGRWDCSDGSDEMNCFT